MDERWGQITFRTVKTDRLLCIKEWLIEAVKMGVQREVRRQGSSSPYTELDLNTFAANKLNTSTSVKDLGCRVSTSASILLQAGVLRCVCRTSMCMHTSAPSGQDAG